MMMCHLFGFDDNLINSKVMLFGRYYDWIFFSLALATGLKRRGILSLFIFQDKIIGIQTCAEGILNSSHDNGLVEILSASQSALKALQVVEFDSEVMLNSLRIASHWDGRQDTLRLVETNLGWVG